MAQLVKDGPWRASWKGQNLLSCSTEILSTEKEVAQSLVDSKEKAHQGGAELQQLEAELQKASEEDTRLKATLLYPFLCAWSGSAAATSEAWVHSC